MPYMLIRHKVTNYPTWKAAFDALASSRKEMGSKGAQVLQSADDPNEVVILLEGSDLAKMRAWATSADLKNTMQTAGVADKPDVFFINKAAKSDA
jgi:hypothetical protein